MQRVTHVSAVDPLRLSHCPGCGYALDGLPPEGTCPECGGPYDQSAVVLHGFGAGQHSNLATARPGMALVVGLLCVGYVWWGVHDWLRGGRDTSTLFWVVVLLVWVAWSIWKRSTSDMPGLVQVRLGAYGALQVNNPAAGKANLGKVTPWRDVTDVSLRPARDGTFRIRMLRRISFWRARQYPVDAEVPCTPEQAAALEQRIEAWRSADFADGPPKGLRATASDAIIGVPPQ
jgi:hypothetical protein